MENLEIIISVSILIVVILLIVIGYIITRKGKSEPWRKDAQEKLKELMILSSNNEVVFVKTAIVEADKLLDFLLIKHLLPGNTLGERLSDAHAVFSKKENMERAWKGHKVRNSLVHDLSFNPDIKQLRYAFADLAAAIQDLID